MTSFDTSSLIWLKDKYPEDIFPTVWQLFDQSVQAGKIVVSEEVITELSVGTDGLDLRIKQLGAGIVQTNVTIELRVQKIMASHPELVDIKRQRSGCDPYVIAVAQVNSGSVVTEESSKPGKVKIPHVCDHYQVGCAKLLGYMRQSGWRI